METYFPLIRKTFVIGLWIYVGIQMCPAAQSRERNPVLWYFIGLLAFYIPFAIIGFAPPVTMLILMKNGTEIATSVFHTVGIFAFTVGVGVGLASLHRMKNLASAPPRSDL